MNKVIIGVAEYEEEIEECLSLRHRVFVEEQRLFSGNDKDKLDKKSIYIYAKIEGRIVGTVRVTHIKDGTWFGSRLAVERKFRTGIGIRLIKEAERFVIKNGGRRFIAIVQKRAEPLFNRLGWRSVRDLQFHNRPHVLMEAGLVQPKLSLP